MGGHGTIVYQCPLSVPIEESGVRLRWLKTIILLEEKKKKKKKKHDRFSRTDFLDRLQEEETRR